MAKTLKKSIKLYFLSYYPRLKPWKRTLFFVEIMTRLLIVPPTNLSFFFKVYLVWGTKNGVFMQERRQFLWYRTIFMTTIKINYYNDQHNMHNCSHSIICVKRAKFTQHNFMSLLSLKKLVKLCCGDLHLIRNFFSFALT